MMRNHSNEDEMETNNNKFNHNTDLYAIKSLMHFAIHSIAFLPTQRIAMQYKNNI